MSSRWRHRRGASFKAQSLWVPTWQYDEVSTGMRSAVRNDTRSAASSGSGCTCPTWRGAQRRWRWWRMCLSEEFWRIASVSGWVWRMERAQEGSPRRSHWTRRQEEHDGHGVAFHPMWRSPKRGRSFPRTCLAMRTATFGGGILSSCEGAVDVCQEHPSRRYSTWSQPKGQEAQTQSKVY